MIMKTRKSHDLLSAGYGSQKTDGAIQSESSSLSAKVRGPHTSVSSTSRSLTRFPRVTTGFVYSVKSKESEKEHNDIYYLDFTIYF